MPEKPVTAFKQQRLLYCKFEILHTGKLKTGIDGMTKERGAIAETNGNGDLQVILMLNTHGLAFLQDVSR